MPNAYISGTGFYVPPRRVTNDDLRTQYGIDTTHEWILQRTGIEERRFADEGVGSAELGTKAAEAAIAKAGIQKTDLDMIIFATLSPEHCFPGSGVYLQNKLGLCEGPNAKFVPALDVRNQCSGFLYSLGTATSMVKSGACKHVLVVGAEVHSAALDLSTRGRGVASLFGDGAGAVIVSATDEDRGVRTWKLGADGRFADVLAQKVWDIKKRPFIPVNAEGVGQVQPEMLWAQMDGKLVFKNAVERMITVLIGGLHERGLHGQRHRPVRLPPGEQAHQRVHREEPRHPGREARPQHRALRKHDGRHDPDPPRGGGSERPIEARDEGRVRRVRLRVHLGLGDHRLVIAVTAH